MPAALLATADGAPLIIGHRGAMGYRPENTLPAFAYAADLGARWVELDVHHSRDGEVVVIHDARLERTTDGAGFVADHTAAQLRQLDAGSWFAATFAGTRIPTLAEVLTWARQRQVGVDIEIKNGPRFYQGIESAVAALVERHDMLERVLVTSFDHRAVRRVKTVNGRIATGLLYAARPVDAVALAREAGAVVLLPSWQYVVAEDVRAAHDAGLAVVAWTSSDPDVIESLHAAGVDGIVTNHPDVDARHVRVG